MVDCQGAFDETLRWNPWSWMKGVASIRVGLTSGAAWPTGTPPSPTRSPPGTWYEAPLSANCRSLEYINKTGRVRRHMDMVVRYSQTLLEAGASQGRDITGICRYVVICTTILQIWREGIVWFNIGVSGSTSPGHFFLYFFFKWMNRA